MKEMSASDNWRFEFVIVAKTRKSICKDIWKIAYAQMITLVAL